MLFFKNLFIKYICKLIYKIYQFLLRKLRVTYRKVPDSTNEAEQN